jgi:ABC-type transport system involved in multi-copper enzyme maturation permease subunit
MGPGPIFVREMVTSARLWRRFGHRFSNALLMLLVLAGNYAGWYQATDGRFSLATTARFAQTSFGSLVVLQAIMVFVHVTALLARAIAGEKDRKTLGLLLSTDLSAGEIVRDKIVSGLVRVGSTLAAGLPVMVLLVPLGGIDPLWIGMAYAGMASMAIFLAGLSILASALARTERHAAALAVLLGTFWLVGPMFLNILGPRFWPWLNPWVAPVNRWLLASTPFGLALKLLGVMGGGRLVAAVAWMIGLQVLAGLAMMLVAAVVLRPAFRAHAEEGVLGLRRRKARRAPPRPPCGDDPMLWKERHTGQPSLAARLVGTCFLMIMLFPLGYTTFTLGLPALAEAVAHRYTVDQTGSKGTAFDLLVGMLLPAGMAGQAPDAAREQFNAFLRLVSLALDCILAFLLTSTAIDGMTSERAKDTWTGLLATPLSGEEILRAKRFGALWKVRWILFLEVVLWTTGLVAGAIHPAGYLAAMVGLGLTAWALPALGTYSGLVVSEPASASNLGVGIVLLTLASGVLPLFLPTRSATVFQGAVSTPFDSFLALASYRDLQTAWQAGAYPPLKMVGIETGEGFGRVAAAWGLGMVILAASGAYLRRQASQQFDAAVGRPRRMNQGIQQSQSARSSDQSPFLGNTPLALGSAQPSE